jgi:hypothetical protein
LAFLLGYIAHMITDCVVHPVVRLAIANGAGTHAEAELVQDSMIFDDITGEEIKDEDYLSWLDLCKTDKTTFDAVFSFFADLVKAHPYVGFHDCRTWYEAYRTVFSASRVFPIRCESVTYPRLVDISLAKRDQYYLDTKLPAPAGKAAAAVVQSKTDCFVGFDATKFRALVRQSNRKHPVLTISRAGPAACSIVGTRWMARQESETMAQPTVAC